MPALVFEAPARDPDTLAAIDRAPVLRCIVDGAEADLERVWPWLHPITEKAYRVLCIEREGVADTNLHTSSVRI